MSKPADPAYHYCHICRLVNIVTRKIYANTAHMLRTIGGNEVALFQKLPLLLRFKPPPTPQSPVWRLPDGAVALAYSPFCGRPRDQIKL